MISLCAGAGLPEPQFRSEGEHFVTTVWRDWFTDEILAGLDLNERQKLAIQYVMSQGKIGNSEYQEMAQVAKRTAYRDLSNLVEKGLFARRDPG